MNYIYKGLLQFCLCEIPLKLSKVCIINSKIVLPNCRPVCKLPSSYQFLFCSKGMNQLNLSEQLLSSQFLNIIAFKYTVQCLAFILLLITPKVISLIVSVLVVLTQAHLGAPQSILMTLASHRVASFLTLAETHFYYYFWCW